MKKDLGDTVDPPPGTRFPFARDRDAHVELSGLLRGRVSFDEILEYHNPQDGQFTIFAVYEEEIAALACFFVRPEDLFVDYLSRNAAFHPPLKVPGASVAMGAVEFFAEQLGRDFVRLECVDDPSAMAWYIELGFVADGLPRKDAEWGKLCPMAKRVEPLGGAWS